jgi:hypothetical protein
MNPREGMAGLGNGKAWFNSNGEPTPEPTPGDNATKASTRLLERIVLQIVKSARSATSKASGIGSFV